MYYGHRRFVFRILLLLDTDLELVTPAGYYLTTDCALDIFKTTFYLVLLYYMTGY